jgi:hypothetical protein
VWFAGGRPPRALTAPRALGGRVTDHEQNERQQRKQPQAQPALAQHSEQQLAALRQAADDLVRRERHVQEDRDPHPLRRPRRRARARGAVAVAAAALGVGRRGLALRLGLDECGGK